MAVSIMSIIGVHNTNDRIHAITIQTVSSIYALFTWYHANSMPIKERAKSDYYKDSERIKIGRFFLYVKKFIDISVDYKYHFPSKLLGFAPR